MTSSSPGSQLAGSYTQFHRIGLDIVFIGDRVHTTLRAIEKGLVAERTVAMTDTTRSASSWAKALNAVKNTSITTNRILSFLI